MDDINKICDKNKALEAFTYAFNNRKDEPEVIWEYLLHYRRLLGENEIM